MRWAVVSAFLALAQSAFAQLVSGTILYAQWSRDEIVLGADSRDVLGDSYADTGCKIAALDGKVIFAAAGRIARTGRHGWDGVTIANREFLRLTSTNSPDPLTRRLAEAWGKAVQSELENAGAAAFAGLDDRHMAAGIFAMFDNTGSLSIAVASLRYETSGDGYPKVIASVQSIPVKPGAYILGHREILDECAQRRTKRAIQWAGEIEQAARSGGDPLVTGTRKVIELTIDNLPRTKIDASGVRFSVVGPPIALILLRRGQRAEWMEPGQCRLQP